MDGFVNFNKPSGMSSNAAVVTVRKILGEKKIGHLGTLDPLAEGVLPLAVGKAAKLFNYLLDKQKTYIAEFTFGRTTDTLDREGRITERKDFKSTKKEVQEAAKQFVGSFKQMPPKYSAKSVNGARAYDLARQGKEFELTPKTVTVFQFDLLERIDENSFKFEIRCSSGTYIRALARDLAEKLGTAGYMSALLRTQSGVFSLENALTIEQIEQFRADAVLPVSYALSGLETWNVDASLFTQLSNGVKISWEPLSDGYRIIMCDGALFGVGKNNGGKLDLEFYLK